MTRGEYALRECGDCGIQLPANEMTPVSDQVLSSTRRGNRVYRGTRGGVGFGTSGSNTYRVEHKLACPDCLALRIERRRREARARLIGILVFVAILIAIVIGVSRITSSPTASTNLMDSGTGNALGGSLPSNLPIESPEAPDNAPAPPPTGAEEASGASASQGGAAGSVQVDEAERTPQAQDTATDHSEEEAAIVDAAPKALESGQPERWKAAGKSGYVVVSAPQTYRDRTCRNVYATVINGHEQTQSTPHQWCQSNAGGEWAPVR